MGEIEHREAAADEVRLAIAAAEAFALMERGGHFGKIAVSLT